MTDYDPSQDAHDSYFKAIGDLRRHTERKHPYPECEGRNDSIPRCIVRYWTGGTNAAKVCPVSKSVILPCMKTMEEHEHEKGK